MQGHGEWLGHGSGVVVACLGDGAADARGRCHVLGKSAVDLKPERAVLGAQVGATDAAPATAATRDSRSRDDPVTDSECGDVLAELDHTTHELVSENHAGSTEDRAVIPFRSVGATDRGACHL